MNSCSVPSNDADFEGIYKYLCWEAANSGLPSPCLHYLEVLYKAAKLGTEALDILKEIDRVGAFYPSAIEIDIYEDGDEIGEDIKKLLRKAAQSFEPGDRFEFDIDKMRSHNIGLPEEPDRSSVQTVLDVQYIKGLGGIITYSRNPTAQVNACWLRRAR